MSTVVLIPCANRLNVADLRLCSNSTCFFDAAGHRFHLPAFLLVELSVHSDPENWEEVGCIVAYFLGQVWWAWEDEDDDESDDDASDYDGRLEDYKKMFSLFDPAQKAAVRAYMKFFMDEITQQPDHDAICKARDTFWSD